MNKKLSKKIEQQIKKAMIEATKKSKISLPVYDYVKSEKVIAVGKWLADK